MKINQNKKPINTGPAVEEEVGAEDTLSELTFSLQQIGTTIPSSSNNTSLIRVVEANRKFPQAIMNIRTIENFLCFLSLRKTSTKELCMTNPDYLEEEHCRD